MIKYLVIGDPISHSRSPKMQNAAFEAVGMGSPYGIRHVKPAELPEFFEYARHHLRGVNLTVPHKLGNTRIGNLKLALKLFANNLYEIVNGKNVILAMRKHPRARK